MIEPLWKTLGDSGEDDDVETQDVCENCGKPWPCRCDRDDDV